MRHAKSAEPGKPTPPADVLRTARSIADGQRADGALPWPDGHVDPWDHVECAMALSACGLAVHARRAYQWLRDTQRRDGSWPRTTGGAGDADREEGAQREHGAEREHGAQRETATDHAAESHHAAYVAVGVWHEYLVTGDRRFAERMWPTVRSAIDWVLDLQVPRGEVVWERDAADQPGAFALLSGCSSILQGLRCAMSLAELAGEPRPDWELAAVQLGHVIACHPEAFADKSRFSMDWYYPVLGGALRGDAALERLAGGWDTFVVPGLGVRCVSDQPWVTVAETCELVLALDACGQRERAVAVFATIDRLRHEDGSYWTGWQYVNENHFPAERSGWTSAAAVLAADALAGFSGGAAIFRATSNPASFRQPADPAACGCEADPADALTGHG